MTPDSVHSTPGAPGTVLVQPVVVLLAPAVVPQRRQGRASTPPTRRGPDAGVPDLAPRPVAGAARRGGGPIPRRSAGPPDPFLKTQVPKDKEEEGGTTTLPPVPPPPVPPPPLPFPFLPMARNGVGCGAVVSFFGDFPRFRTGGVFFERGWGFWAFHPPHFGQKT